MKMSKPKKMMPMMPPKKAGKKKMAGAMTAFPSKMKPKGKF
jgi:hypothetical protein